MKRRDVVKLGAVAAAATVGVPGCAVPKMLGSLRGPDGAAAFNAMLDEQLGALDGASSLLGRLVEGQTKQPLSPEKSAKLAEKDAMFRRMLSTVLITQAFRELPEDTQVEPAVQERMWKHYDQIGSSLFEITDMLAALDPKERAQVKQTLNERPDLPMELGEFIDERAARAGLSTTRRLQLRKMMAQTSFRLKNGHATSLIDEYVAKVEKLRTTDERNAAAIELASKLGERAFWQRQQQMAHMQPGQQQPSQPPVPPLVPAGPGQPQQPPPLRPAGPPGPAPQQPAPPSAPPAGPEPTHIVLHKTARSAARRGDCRAIELLGKRVQELNPEYFQTTFSADPMLRNCRPGVPVDEYGRPAPAMVAPVPTAPDPNIQKPPRPGSRGLRTGGYMFGIGLAIGAGSGLLFAIGTDGAILAGLFGMTAAVILVGLGLIVVLISAIIYASND